MLRSFRVRGNENKARKEVHKDPAEFHVFVAKRVRPYKKHARTRIHDGSVPKI